MRRKFGSRDECFVRREDGTAVAHVFFITLLINSGRAFPQTIYSMFCMDFETKKTTVEDVFRGRDHRYCDNCRLQPVIRGIVELEI